MENIRKVLGLFLILAGLGVTYVGITGVHNRILTMRIGEPTPGGIAVGIIMVIVGVILVRV